MLQITMSTRINTLYTVEGLAGREYETFDYDKAQRALALESSGIACAECMDCKAVIPVDLVDRAYTEGNVCPATKSLTHLGHRVRHEDYEAGKAAQA